MGLLVSSHSFTKITETKCIKSGGKSQLSLSFLASTVNDVRRKLYTVGIHSTVEKRAKRMPDTTVETTIVTYMLPLPGESWLEAV